MQLSLGAVLQFPVIRQGTLTPVLSPSLGGLALEMANPGWPVFQALSIQILREGLATEDPKFVALYVGDTAATSTLFAYYRLGTDPQTQRFRTELLRGQFLVHAFDQGEPRLGIMRWPVFDAETAELLYNLSEDQSGAIATLPARVEVRTRVDAEALARPVVVVERQADGQWRIAGAASTDMAGGGYIPLEVTLGGTCYALGLDDWGTLYEPGLAVTVGQRIRPTLFKGWLYRITQAGSLPASEPAWWDGNTAGPQDLGSARAEVVRYHRPLAHGPITVETT